MEGVRSPGLQVLARLRQHDLMRAGRSVVRALGGENGLGEDGSTLPCRRVMRSGPLARSPDQGPNPVLNQAVRDAASIEAVRRLLHADPRRWDLPRRTARAIHEEEFFTPHPLHPSLERRAGISVADARPASSVHLAGSIF